MIPHQDEILIPAVSSDRTAVPRYDVVAPDGKTIYENVALKLANNVAQPGTPINKPLLDEFLAASGITAGSATAYTLAQEGYSLFDGAPVRFRLHTASGEGATLNINGTGAKPLRDVLGETMNEGIPAGTWLTATYSAEAGAYIIMSGGVKRSIDEAINGEQYTVDDAVGYAKDVPENVLPYAEISEIGGMTYKDGNTLRSAPVTEVESVGANLIPYPYAVTSQTKNGLSLMVNSNGTIVLNGTTTAGASFIIGTAKVVVGEKYIFKILSGNGSLDSIYGYVKKGKTGAESDYVYDLGNGCEFTGEHETVSISLVVPYAGKTFDNHVLYPRINRGTTALPYTPYFRENLPIPEAVRALDGYGWGINETVRNYVDWKNRKFVKMVERADLGTLDYGQYGSGIAAAELPYPIKSPAILADDTPNGIMRFGTDDDLNAVSVYFDPAVISFGDLKTVLSGKRFFYELATPVITDISSLLPADNILRVQPGGTVTPINEHGYAVPSTITYQRNVLNNRASTFEVEKVRAQQNGITVTLAAGAWSGNTQTIAVPGVTADNTVICSPDPASHDAYGKYGVYCISQADGRLTFRCKRTPDTALAVNIIAMGG